MAMVKPLAIPEELRDLYFDMVKCGVKARLTKDLNYLNLKDSGRFSSLDNLQ